MTRLRPTQSPPGAESLLPDCLQPRGPARYTVRDGNGQKLGATLAGSRLGANAEYRVRVSLQQPPEGPWKLKFANLPYFVESPESSAGSGKTCELSFRTKTRFGGLARMLRSASTTDLPLRLQLPYGRHPYELEIPVILAGRWWIVPVAIAGLALPLLWKLPIPWWGSLLAATGVLSLVAGGFFVFDRVLLHRRSQALASSLRAAPEPPGDENGVDGDGARDSLAPEAEENAPGESGVESA